MNSLLPPPAIHLTVRDHTDYVWLCLYLLLLQIVVHVLHYQILRPFLRLAFRHVRNNFIVVIREGKTADGEEEQAEARPKSS